jgi:hypothetical protein
MDAPDRQIDLLRVQGLLPGQHVLIEAVDERAVEIEQENGFDTHSQTLRPLSTADYVASGDATPAQIFASGFGRASALDTEPRIRRRDRLAKAPTKANAAATSARCSGFVAKRNAIAATVAPIV